MNKEKKRWETPKLICLYRGRGEETVLTICKIAGLTEPGYVNCWQAAQQKCQNLNGS